MVRRLAFWLVVLLLPLQSHAGAVFWLGGGGAPCNFSTLSTALGAVPQGATIRIANNQAYTNVNLTLANRSVTLEGGWADCAGTPSAARTVIEGAAGANLPVLRVQAAGTARNVRLDHLEIRGGTHGGLEVNGLLDVRLEDTLVTANSGVSGGGIIVLGATPAQTVLRLVHSVVGASESGASPGNTATAGAGVYCDHARVQLSSALIQGNVATDRGGGLALVACTLDAAGPELAIDGYGLLSALVRDNVGGFFGGGLYARLGSTVGLDTNDQPVVFAGNSAGRGGALYLRDAGTRFDGAAITLDGNHADEFGGAAYVQNGAFLGLERGADGDACRPGAICSRVLDNSVGAAPTSGSAAIQLSNASATIAQTEIAGNVSTLAAQATFFLSAGSQLRVLDSTLHDNAAADGHLFRLFGTNNGVILGSSTIVRNIAASPLIDIDNSSGSDAVFFALGILWQPGLVAVDTTDGDLVQAVCVNAHPESGLVAVSQEPSFVDADTGDLRLRTGSPDIDACTQTGLFGSTGSGFDIAGRERPQVLTDAATPYDRGAFELPDRIFADGFEEPGFVP